MSFDGRTRCKLCGSEHRLSEPHRFPNTPDLIEVPPKPPAGSVTASPRPLARPPGVSRGAVASAIVSPPAPTETSPADVSRDARRRLLSAAASRAYRARQKAEIGTASTRTSVERQRRYRVRQRAALAKL